MKSNDKSAESVARLVLIDSHALIHRAYHGIPPLKTKDGVLVNAVYGFTTAVFKALEDFKPRYIAAAFDLKGPTVRHEEYKEYKAKRPPAPDDLIKQFDLVKDICNVLNIPVVSMKGYEADDIIGTITSEVRRKKLEVRIIIVTGDMDALQLVNENVVVYSMSRGIKQAEIFDVEKVKEKYGFAPEQLVDYKALRGDPSDNIPGVPGIGEKTATSLIKIFGNIENLYEQISSYKQQKTNKSQIPNSKLSNKTIELLIKNKKQAFLSKKLATIIKNVPIDFKLSDCLVHDYDKKKAEEVFRKFEFKSLLSRLPEEKRNNKQTTLF